MSEVQRFHLYVTGGLQRQQGGGTRIQANSWVGGLSAETRHSHPPCPLSVAIPKDSPGVPKQSWEYSQAGLTTDTSGRVLTLLWVVSPFPSRSSVFWK